MMIQRGSDTPHFLMFF